MCYLKKYLIYIFLFLGIILADSLLQSDSLDSLPSDNDFITQKEYGQYLYENPRGISCKVCHGSYGEGSLLATYTHLGHKKEIKAPDITNLSLERFTQGLKNSKGAMPKYYLTNPEINAIYYYIIDENH